MKKSYPAKLENLGAIAADIESFCASNGLEDMCFQINLCVEEVFANCYRFILADAKINSFDGLRLAAPRAKFYPQILYV